jgi:hypothetical protein
MSSFKMGASSFDAFSGMGDHKNRFLSECVPNIGPIPRGEYLIFDRQTGGKLGRFREFFSNKSDWFALYAVDEKIDDAVYCEKLMRGEFRLHPRGELGISRGCITVEDWTDYQVIKSLLKCTKTEKVVGSDLDYYGTVRVW